MAAASVDKRYVTIKTSAELVQDRSSLHDNNNVQGVAGDDVHMREGPVRRPQ